LVAPFISRDQVLEWLSEVPDPEIPVLTITSIDRVLSPPWTTDWISEDGREKLREYGIAPPEQGASKRALLQGERSIACPRCQSQDTEVVSEFGSTACKAAYKCKACLEPFEYFKCI
jgi:ring-1,2-phenylacetyl-CoA epoxidase subunit PaaD